MNTKLIEKCLIQKNIANDLLHIAVLKGEDVITTRISDHHPIVHDDALFWNVMMKGRIRQVKNGMSFNNGFGIVEDEKQYTERLAKIAYVIVEIIARYPAIKNIGLCEGPIESEHVNILLSIFKKFHCMQRFLKNNKFHSPSHTLFPNWGLLMLADKKYTVTKTPCNFIEHTALFSKLANRFQIWKLTSDYEEKYFALAHFPFGGDELLTSKDKFSILGKVYSKLINTLLSQYTNDEFLLCADFNLNPYLINEYSDRVMDRIEANNSIVLTTEQNVNYTNTATVDGILLSIREKQRYSCSISNPGLLRRLLKEHALFQSKIQKIQHDEPQFENRSPQKTRL